MAKIAMPTLKKPLIYLLIKYFEFILNDMAMVYVSLDPYNCAFEENLDLSSFSPPFILL